MKARWLSFLVLLLCIPSGFAQTGEPTSVPAEPAQEATPAAQPQPASGEGITALAEQMAQLQKIVRSLQAEAGVEHAKRVLELERKLAAVVAERNKANAEQNRLQGEFNEALASEQEVLRIANVELRKMQEQYDAAVIRAEQAEQRTQEREKELGIAEQTIAELTHDMGVAVKMERTVNAAENFMEQLRSGNVPRAVRKQVEVELGVARDMDAIAAAEERAKRQVTLSCGDLKTYFSRARVRACERKKIGGVTFYNDDGGSVASAKVPAKAGHYSGHWLGIAFDTKKARKEFYQFFVEKNKDALIDPNCKTKTLDELQKCAGRIKAGMKFYHVLVRKPTAEQLKAKEERSKKLAKRNGKKWRAVEKKVGATGTSATKPRDTSVSPRPSAHDTEERVCTYRSEHLKGAFHQGYNNELADDTGCVRYETRKVRVAPPRTQVSSKSIAPATGASAQIPQSLKDDARRRGWTVLAYDPVAGKVTLKKGTEVKTFRVNKTK